MAMRSVVPLFRVPDVKKTATWYHEHLGFEVDAVPKDPPWVFAMLRRDLAELMLRRSLDWAGPAADGAWDAYIRLRGNVIRTLHDQLTVRGIVRRPLVRMPYGMCEFDIRDCDGRIVCLAEDLADPSGIAANSEMK